MEYIDGYRSCCKYYCKGNVNIILSAPHGGSLIPNDVPDRTGGICIRRSDENDTLLDKQFYNTKLVKDIHTDEFTENVANELFERWNFKPFIIIGKWHRQIVDFNREIREGTLNHPEAVAAYENYHLNLNNAISHVNQLFNKGLLIDIHGHSQGNYTMIGYMLSSNQLNEDDLSHSSFATSIESLCLSNKNECIRGKKSFGTILEQNGIDPVYPSLKHPKPESRTFFSGGYTICNYFSKINAIQTELPYVIRTGENKCMNAQRFAQTIVEYMQINNLLMSN
ncbi:unnamed protein product [Adineta steineri]|uniref:N-formylglutamate amidohydrolase n=1 Tax=Adineta steineri TaxID=433720 RepID=A0A814E634_9BILA|nr:unnamed protein product [Adineta steineri]CAF0965165.1 unnamed protein product [Adineta steineri]CAF3558714.1 unnamed protein product [Adineta steineri]CAF3884109.1 unnamed protein product [Adineta steineri]